MPNTLNLRRTAHNVRAAAHIARATPAYAAGIRAAVAAVAPLAVAQLLGLSGGTWMSIAGLNGALVDRSGPYRVRALTIVGQAALTAVAVALGALAAGRLALAVPLALALGVACSLGRAWGNVGANLGNTALLGLVVSLAFPAPAGGGALAREALARAGWVLAGGVWALVLMVGFWPLHPNRPSRRAVAACWRALARYADEIAARAVPGASRDDTHAAPTAWTELPQPATVRAQIEQARGVLAAARRGRAGETARAEQLLVLHEIADQTFGHLIALWDAVEAVAPADRDPAAETVLAETLAVIASTARALADATEAERGAAPVPVAWGGDALAAVAAAGVHPAAAAHYAHAAALVDRVAAYARGAATAAAALGGAPAPPDAAAVVPPGAAMVTPPVPMPEVEPAEPGPSPAARLRAVLARESVVLRHALRVGLVTAAAVGLAAALRLDHGFWVTITVVVILQPYTGMTTQRALQRLAGTVLGAMLTAGLGAVFRDPWAILALAFVFSAACVALLPLSYAAFSVFLTPAFVLLAEASTGDWHLAGVRVTNTLLGGVLALLGARLLWPAPEWNRVPTHAAAALRALGGYVRAAAALLAAPPGTRDDGRVRDARRGVGLATTNAEESFQRLLGEHRGPAEALEPVMATLTYVRRVGAAVGALVLARHAAGPPPREVVEALADAAASVLDDLADAVADRRAPAPLPPLPEPPRDSPHHARVTRLVRLLQVLHDAVARWVAPPATPAPPATGARQPSSRSVA